MSPSPHLQAAQFGTAKEQGKPVSDWLASDEGHQWQNANFDRVDQRHLSPETNLGMFSIKDDGDAPGRAEIYPDDLHFEENKQSHLTYEAEAYQAVQAQRRRAEEWVNEPARPRSIYNDQRGVWE